MITKKHLPILITILAALAYFTYVFSTTRNVEFLGYIAVIVVLGGLILWSNRRYQYSLGLLWGLTIWGIMHMAGGGMIVGGDILYKLILFPISAEYQILKYDQVVHAFGFAIATVLTFELLRPMLLRERISWGALGLILFVSGLGFGAINEIIEFVMVVVLPETGVGGYVNTSLDLVSNGVGALVATLYIWRKEQKTL